MKAIRLIAAMLLVFSLVACTTGETAGINILSQDVASGGLSGTLEIYMEEKWYSTSLKHNLIKGFNELNPDVEIIISGDKVDSMNMEREEVDVAEKTSLNDLKMRMSSGDAPDLIFGLNVSYKDFLGGNSLWDLYEFMEADESFNEEDYFMQVIDAMEVGGKLPAMPLTFSTSYYRLNKTILDAVGISENDINILDYNFLIDTYNAVVDSGKFPEFEALYMESRRYTSIPPIEDEIASKTDTTTLTTNYESDEFISFLKKIATYEGKIDYTADEMIENADYYIFPFPDNRFLLSYSMSFFPLYIDQTVTQYENATTFYPLSCSDGKTSVYTNGIAMPKAAKNAELAWEFIKYCMYESETVGVIEVSKAALESIGRWDGDRFDGHIPINKNNFEKYFGKIINRYSDEEKANFYERVDTIFSGEIYVDMRPLDLIISQANIVIEYLDGLMTAEDCAKALQDRTELYFGELR